MRASAIVAMTLLAISACGKSSGKDGGYAADSPQHAFVRMQQALRAADAAALWEMYSDAMREDMAAKIRVLIDRADDVVERDLGRPKAELDGMSAREVYAILIGKKELQDELSTELPRIDQAVGDPQGTVVIHYREADGRVCRQPMDRVAGAWKVAARPTCSAP